MFKLIIKYDFDQMAAITRFGKSINNNANINNNVKIFGNHRMFFALCG